MKVRRTPLKLSVLTAAFLFVAVAPVFAADVLKFGATARSGVIGQTISIPVVIQDNTLTPAGYDRVGVDEKMQYIAFKMIFTGGLVEPCSANTTNCKFVEAGIAPSLSPLAVPEDPCDALVDGTSTIKTPATPCYWRSETKTPAGGDTTNSFSYIVAFQNPLATTDTSTVRGNLVGYVKVKMAATGTVTPVIQDAAFMPNPPGDPSVNAYLSGYDVYAAVGTCLWCADPSTEETIANTSLSLASYRPVDTEPDADVDATDLTNVITAFEANPNAPVVAGTYTKDCDGDGVLTGKDVFCVYYELNPHVLTTPSNRSSLVDVDLSGSKLALQDGLMIFRRLASFPTASLTVGTVPGTALRQPAAEIESYINTVKPAFDVDGNGSVSALQDGLMIFRYLAGFRAGTGLTTGALPGNATRNAAQVEAYINALVADVTPLY